MKEYSKAKDYLEKAWESGHREPSAAYDLGKTLGILWQQEWIDAGSLSSRPLQEKVRREAYEKYAEPAIVYLQQAHGYVESPAYVEG